MEQWQCVITVGGASISQRTPPHRQLPSIIFLAFFSQHDWSLRSG
jgi:hypothetical protein